MINLKTNDWEIKNIDTVLFDKDGTLVDLHFFWGKMTELRAEAIIKYYNLNSELKNELCEFLGYNINTKKMLEDGITAMYSRSKIIDIFNKYLKKLGINSSTKEIEQIFDDVMNKFNENITNYILPIDSAINFAKKLNTMGIKLGIVTSDSVVSTKLTLSHLGWNDIFKTVIGRESSPHTKESGALTKLALKNLQSNPKTTLMIGDAPMDFISAKNANIDNIILVSTGQIEIKKLNETCNTITDNLSNIIVNKCNNKS